MNNDLISRSALLEAIDAEFFKTDPLGEEQLGFLTCRRIARTAPAVDAEPVRHGRWYDKGVCGYSHMHDWRCSVCEYVAGVNPIGPKHNYCPNCGAKMDGDKDD